MWNSHYPSENVPNLLQSSHSLQSQGGHSSQFDEDPYAPVWQSDDEYTPEELARRAVTEAKRVERESKAPKPPTQYTTSMGRRKHKKGVAKDTPPVSVYNPFSLLAEKPKVQPKVNPTSYISLETYENQQKVEATYRQTRGWQIQKQRSAPPPIDPQAPVPGKEGVILLSQPPL